MDIDGAVIIITGAGSGIGAATAKAANAAGSIPPHMRPHSGRGVKQPLIRDGQLHQPKHEPVVALEGDQRPGVEHYSPRARRAHASWSSVGGPTSALISASSSASAWRLTFSAIAWSTHALRDGASPCATASPAAARTSGRTVTVTRDRCIRSSCFPVRAARARCAAQPQPARAAT